MGFGILCILWYLCISTLGSGTELGNLCPIWVGFLSVSRYAGGSFLSISKPGSGTELGSLIPTWVGVVGSGFFWCCWSWVIFSMVVEVGASLVSCILFLLLIRYGVMIRSAGAVLHLQLLLISSRGVALSRSTIIFFPQQCVVSDMTLFGSGQWLN